MKIPENVLKPDIESQIKSLRMLYQNYDNEIYHGCPLCRSSIELAMLKEGDKWYTPEWVSSPICGYCPWVWITGKRCKEFKQGWGMKYSKQRMLEIKQWIKELEDKC